MQLLAAGARDSFRVGLLSHNAEFATVAEAMAKARRGDVILLNGDRFVADEQAWISISRGYRVAMLRGLCRWVG